MSSKPFGYSPRSSGGLTLSCGVAVGGCCCCCCCGVPGVFLVGGGSGSDGTLGVATGMARCCFLRCGRFCPEDEEDPPPPPPGPEADLDLPPPPVSSLELSLYESESSAAQAG